MRRATDNHLALAVAEKIAGKDYEAFVIDKRMGRQTRVGSSLKVWDIYANAFERAGVRSRMTGHWFIPGNDDPEERSRITRNMLINAEEGMPATVHTGRVCRNSQ